jgi:hypothetical protein
VTVYIGESSLDDFSAQVLTHNTFTYYSTVEWIVNSRRKIKNNKMSYDSVSKIEFKNHPLPLSDLTLSRWKHRINTHSVLRSVRRLLVEANVVPNSLILVTLKIVALNYSEMSGPTRATRRNIPEDGILPNHPFLIDGQPLSFAVHKVHSRYTGHIGSRNNTSHLDLGAVWLNLGPETSCCC